MKYSIVLFKDYNKGLSKLQQEELIYNSPNANILIKHVKSVESKERALKDKVDKFPTIIIYDSNVEIYRHVGYIASVNINKILKEYETEHVV